VRSSRIVMYGVPVLGLGIIIAGVVLLLGEFTAPSEAEDTGPLLLWADRALQPPLAGAELEHGGGLLGLHLRRTGQAVEVEYDSGAALLRRLSESGRGDLFLPIDGDLIEQAQQQGLVDRLYTIGHLAPVILVSRGYERPIRTVSDLADPELRLAVAAAGDSTIGRVTQELLARHGVSLAEHRLLVRAGPTAMDLAQRVQFGEADAAIVWRTVANQFPRNTRIVPIPAEDNVMAPLRLAVLTVSGRPDDAHRLAAFLTSGAAGELLGRYGYDAGPAGSDQPGQP
jgi:molybdate transport system substrate-binding protein